jgi:hypothetical protein
MQLLEVAPDIFIMKQPVFEVEKKVLCLGSGGQINQFGK